MARPSSALMVGLLLLSIVSTVVTAQGVPSATISLQGGGSSASEFPSASISVEVTLGNTDSANLGYAPFAEVITSSGLDLTSALSLVNEDAVFAQHTFTDSAPCFDHPWLSGAEICGDVGSMYTCLKLPYTSMSADQTPVPTTLSITLPASDPSAVDSSGALGSEFIYARAGFANSDAGFGGSPVVTAAAQNPFTSDADQLSDAWLRFDIDIVLWKLNIGLSSSTIVSGAFASSECSSMWVFAPGIVATNATITTTLTSGLLVDSSSFVSVGGGEIYSDWTDTNVGWGAGSCSGTAGSRFAFGARVDHAQSAWQSSSSTSAAYAVSSSGGAWLDACSCYVSASSSASLDVAATMLHKSATLQSSDIRPGSQISFTVGLDVSEDASVAQWTATDALPAALSVDTASIAYTVGGSTNLVPAAYDVDSHSISIDLSAPLGVGASAAYFSYTTTVLAEYPVGTNYECDTDGFISQHDLILNSVSASASIVDNTDNSATLTQPLTAAKSLNVVSEPSSHSIALVAVNGVPITVSDRPRVAPLDLLTFEMDYTLPTADVEDLSLRLFLPDPLLDSAELDGSPLSADAYPGAGLYSLAPEHDFGAWAAAVSADNSQNAIEYAYGTRQWSGAANSELALRQTVTVGTSPFVDDVDLAAESYAYEGQNTGTCRQSYRALQRFVVLQPKVVVVHKSVGSSTTAYGAACTATISNLWQASSFLSEPTSATYEAGATSTVTLLVQNQGDADAYDVRVTDTAPPAGFAVVVDSLCVLDAANPSSEMSGTGTYTDLIGSNGLFVADKLAPGDSVLVTYDIVVDDQVHSGLVCTDATILSEVTQFLNGPGAESHLATGAKSACFQSQPPKVTAYVESTSESHTANSHLCVRETATIRATVVFARGLTKAARFQINSHSGSSVVSATVLHTPNITGSFDLDTFVQGGSFNQALGDVVRHPSVSDADASLVIEFTAVFDESNSNIVENRKRSQFVKLHHTPVAVEETVWKQVPFRVREPEIESSLTWSGLVESFDSNNWVADDVLRLSMSFANGRLDHAFDTQITMAAVDAALVPDMNTLSCSVALGNTPSLDPSHGTYALHLGTVEAGDTVTCTLDYTVQRSAGCGLHVAANIEQISFAGCGVEGERRTYALTSGLASATATLAPCSLSLSIASTSNSLDHVVIGERITFLVELVLPPLSLLDGRLSLDVNPAFVTTSAMSSITTVANVPDYQSIVFDCSSGTQCFLDYGASLSNEGTAFETLALTFSIDVGDLPPAVDGVDLLTRVACTSTTFSSTTPYEAVTVSEPLLAAVISTTNDDLLVTGSLIEYAVRLECDRLDNIAHQVSLIVDIGSYLEYVSGNLTLSAVDMTCGTDFIFSTFVARVLPGTPAGTTLTLTASGSYHSETVDHANRRKYAVTATNAQLHLATTDEGAFIEESITVCEPVATGSEPYTLVLKPATEFDAAAGDILPLGRGVDGFQYNCECRRVPNSRPEYERLFNGDFELASDDETSALPASWVAFKQGGVRAKTWRRGSLSNTCVLSNTEATDERGLAQTVDLGGLNSNLEISGWAAAELVSGEKSSDFSIYVDVIHTDGTFTWGAAVLMFDTGTHAAQYRSTVYVPTKPIRYLNIHVLLRNRIGTAIFDDISVRLTDKDPTLHIDNNLLLNGNFQWRGSGLLPYLNWAHFESGYQAVGGGSVGWPLVVDPDADESVENWVLMMSSLSGASLDAGAWQLITFEEPVYNGLLISGWSRSVGVSGSPDSNYAIYVDVAYDDFTNEWGFNLPFPTGTTDWNYREGLFVPDLGKKVKEVSVYCMFRGHTGTAMFADIEVKLATDADIAYRQQQAMSLPPNAGFEVLDTGLDGHAESWYPFADGGYTTSRDNARSGSNCIAVTPAGEQAGARITLDLNQEVARTVTVSGWSKASEVVLTPSLASNYAIYADVVLADGSSVFGLYGAFTQGTHDWEYAELVIDEAQPITSISLLCLFRYGSGTAWFDDILVEQAPLIVTKVDTIVPPFGLNYGDSSATAAMNSCVRRHAACTRNIEGGFRADGTYVDAVATADDLLADVERPAAALLAAAHRALVDDATDAAAIASANLAYADLAACLVDGQDEAFWGVDGLERVTYPTSDASSSVATLAFEDLFPFAGDADYNDLVVNLRAAEVRDTTTGHTSELQFESRIVARGAGYTHAFRVRLPAGAITGGCEIVVRRFNKDMQLEETSVTHSCDDDTVDVEVELFGDSKVAHLKQNTHVGETIDPHAGWTAEASVLINHPELHVNGLNAGASLPYDPYMYVHNTKVEVHVAEIGRASCRERV